MHFQQEPVELTYTYKGKISNLKLFNKILYARQRYFFPLGCKILLEVLKNWLRYRCWHGDVFCRFEPYNYILLRIFYFIKLNNPSTFASHITACSNKFSYVWQWLS